MVEFKFNMLEEDYDRLYAEKDRRGRDDLNGNQFARMLLHEYLWKLQPHTPGGEEYDPDISND